MGTDICSGWDGTGELGAGRLFAGTYVNLYNFCPHGLDWTGLVLPHS